MKWRLKKQGKIIIISIEMENRDMNLTKQIKACIDKTLKKAGIHNHKIYLFGSRARSEAKKDSDFDLLILVESDLIDSEKMDLFGKIRLELMAFRYSFDIIIKTIGDFEKERNTFGTLSYSIQQEAVPL